EVAQGDFDISSIPVDEIQFEEITDLNLSSSVSKPEQESLLAIESSSENMDEMTDQWTGFLAGSGATKAGTTSFFGLEARGSKFIYVVDKSGSMRGPKLLAAKAEMCRSINSLGNDMEFLIIFFDHLYETMPGDKLARATRQNKLRYFNWVKHVGNGGGTQPVEAMLKAISLKPDAIWLLSDGQFSENACDVIGDANRGSRISIHTIAFYNNYGEALLTRIADENNGKYRFVSPSDLRSNR
ncbi:MAG: hypothetical protein KAR11_08185, partial [Phycisphaerae bacterium]|nr:hypothetical protein [Phycisphaerae bacterium]